MKIFESFKDYVMASINEAKTKKIKDFDSVKIGDIA